LVAEEQQEQPDKHLYLMPRVLVRLLGVLLLLGVVRVVMAVPGNRAGQAEEQVRLPEEQAQVLEHLDKVMQVVQVQLTLMAGVAARVL
jgi:hypothetical protein